MALNGDINVNLFKGSDNLYLKTLLNNVTYLIWATGTSSVRVLTYLPTFCLILSVRLRKRHK
jgi:hypothetical protein